MSRYLRSMVVHNNIIRILLYVWFIKIIFSRRFFQFMTFLGHRYKTKQITKTADINVFYYTQIIGFG